MFILTYSNYNGGYFPYVKQGIEGKSMETEIEKLEAPKTTTTALPETYTSDNTAIDGGNLDKKKLKDKLDKVKLHNPSTKLRKFINLKI